MAEDIKYIFDFDGVIANSNHIKLKSFLDVCNYFFPDQVIEFKRYLIDNSSKSRYEKFSYLIKSTTTSEIKIDELLKKFSELNNIALNDVELSKVISETKFLDRNRGAIISAADEKELKILARKRFKHSFEQSLIFGSPKSKYDSFSIITETYNTKDCCYFGDSFDDLIFASKVNLNFVFIKKWALKEEIRKFENHGWNKITSYNSLDDFFENKREVIV